MQDRLRHVTEAPALLLRAGLGLGTRGRNRMVKHRKIAVAAALVAAGLTATSLSAATLAWDPDGTAPVNGGSGTWNTSSAFWTADDGGSYTNWSNATPDSAIFGGTAGTVSLGSAITAAALTFDANDYII